VSIKVAYPSDQDSQKNGAKNDQEERERDFWNLEPSIILHWKEDEAKGDRVLILNAKKKKNEKDYHPNQCPNPPHFFVLLSGLLFSPRRPTNAERSFS
jgi:hypothetical protein